MEIGGVEFTAAPSLIVVVLVLVGLAVYQAATKNRDDQRSSNAIAGIRRCPDCQQIVGKTATTCRHCKAELWS